MTPSKNQKQTKTRKANLDTQHGREDQNPLTLKDFLGNVQTVVLIFAGIVTAIVEGKNLVETQPYGLIILICILAVIVSGVSIFQLWRKKDTSTKNLFIIPTSLLTIAIITAVIFLFKSPPCEFNEDPFANHEFGILIATFTTSDEDKDKGFSLADQAYDAIETKIFSSNLQNTVKVQRTCEIENPEQAKEIGKKQNAKMVVWGDITTTKDLYLALSLTPVTPIKENPALPDIIIADNLYFQTKISEQITSYSAFLVGLAKFEEGKYSEAIGEFSIAIENVEANSNDPNIGGPQKDKLKRALATFYTLRGDAYTANGDSVLAKADYEKALTYDKSYYLAYIGLGNYYYNEAEFSLAEKEFTTVIDALKVNDPSAYYGRGNSLYNQGKRKHSIDDYLSAIKYTDGDSSNIRFVLAKVYFELGERAKGIEELKLILDSSISDSNVKLQATELLNSITKPFEICGNNVDDDGDGQVDEGCPVMSPTNTPSGPRACNDGIDNDGDAFIDLADPQCKNNGDNDESQ